MDQIINKIAIITGGAGGIGIQIAEQFLNNGIKIIALFDLENSNTRAAFAKLEKNCAERVELYSCDVTNKAQFEENFEKVLKSHKTIDILINIAGIIDDIRAELMIDLNYKAVVLGTLLFIERLGKHKGGNGGVIVNIASRAGVLNNPFLPIYCSTKHAVVSFTRCLNEQCNVTGVRVMAICPGRTDTKILPSLLKTLDFISLDDKRLVGLPTQPPQSVANAVVKMMEKGKSGDVWVVDKINGLYAVKDIKDVSCLRIPIDDE